MYGADTLACIAIGDQNRPEGPGFFACSRPTAPKGSLVSPQITRCNYSPKPPSSVRASYNVLPLLRQFLLCLLAILLVLASFFHTPRALLGVWPEE